MSGQIRFYVDKAAVGSPITSTGGRNIVYDREKLLPWEHMRSMRNITEMDSGSRVDRSQ